MWKLENGIIIKLKIVHNSKFKETAMCRMDLFATHFIFKQMNNLLWWSSQRTHSFLCYMWIPQGSDAKSDWNWPSFNIIALKHYTEELIFREYRQYCQTNGKVKYLVYEYDSLLFSCNSFLWQIWISILTEEKQWFNLFYSLALSLWTIKWMLKTNENQTYKNLCTARKT